MNIHQIVTDKIIAIMEEGVSQGKRRWTQSLGGGLPCNAKTGKPYNGINVLLLWVEAAERGFTSGSWLTYKQAQAMGGQVRKGEKSVLCVFYDKVKRAAKDGEDDTFYSMAKPFWLFNLEQIDGFTQTAASVETRAFSPMEEAERVLADSGATIRHGFDSAYYSPGRDEICLPDRERFTSEANYYATALHELAHWTGHASRLNRTFGKRFGDHAYAREELVAELSSAFSMGQLGLVDGTIEGHAYYLSKWVACLKEDNGAIFTAASKAGKASDFILQRCMAGAVAELEA